ncbi:MAG: hypothetical protein HRU70_09340 [Phycisphaeraceae bacterium]|nr:MAG: hypothetical protein HRU70_09340 [Phycisphaeraceae bacterium]
MKGRSGVMAVGVLVSMGVVSSAVAQTPLPLRNPGFEELNPFSGSGEPTGWHNLSSPADCVRRVVDDGLSPAVTPRTGQACIQITNPTGSFRGFTTDTLNFFEPGIPYYDPVFDFSPAGGDVLVTGWYMIPENAPIEGDAAGIKLNVKRFNQDYGAFDPWGRGGPLVSGHTGGEWRFYQVRWTMAEIREDVDFNDRFNCGGTGEPCSGCFQDCPPVPSRVKITIGRFGTTGSGSGIIFWDDITYEQVPPEPECPADFNGDGFVDFFDFQAYADCFEGVECPEGKDADFNGDGFVDFFDLDSYIAAFEAGC